MYLHHNHLFQFTSLFLRVAKLLVHKLVLKKQPPPYQNTFPKLNCYFHLTSTPSSDKCWGLPCQKCYCEIMQSNDFQFLMVSFFHFIEKLWIYWPRYVNNWFSWILKTISVIDLKIQSVLILFCSLCLWKFRNPIGYNLDKI